MTTEVEIDVVQSISDLPSGDPVPLADAPQPQPPPQPKPLPIQALVQATPSHIDAFLSHLHRCIQTPAGVDTLLLFIGYTARLTAASLQAATGPAIQRSAQRLLAVIESLPPKATLVLNSRALLPSPSVALLLRIAKRLKVLSGLLSEVRAFMRLFGLLNMYFYARGLVLKRRAASRALGEDEKKKKQPPPPPENRVEDTIAWAQLVMGVGFQVLENAVFLAGKGVLEMAPERQGRWARWSARFFGASVGTELGRLLYEAHRRSRRTARERIGDKTVAEAEAEERAWSASWRKSLLRNMAWAPLTVHWSLEQGFVSELAVGALGTIPGVIGVRDLWKRTAE